MTSIEIILSLVVALLVVWNVVYFFIANLNSRVFRDEAIETVFIIALIDYLMEYVHYDDGPKSYDEMYNEVQKFKRLINTYQNTDTKIEIAKHRIRFSSSRGFLVNRTETSDIDMLCFINYQLSLQNLVYEDEPVLSRCDAVGIDDLYKGDGGQFSGSGASGTWEPPPPLPKSTVDNTDVRLRNDYKDESSYTRSTLDSHSTRHGYSYDSGSSHQSSHHSNHDHSSGSSGGSYDSGSSGGSYDSGSSGSSDSSSSSWD